MNKRLFGTHPEGEEIYIYTLTDGMASVEIMNYGASVVSIKPFGDLDVAGGFDALEDYLASGSNQGAIMGRVTNRIAGAKFVLNGKEYHLTADSKGNCLHGGVGFQRKVWKVENVTDNSITLSHTSPDGDNGFPATVNVTVTYTLQDSALIISYSATPDGDTPINLTNHTYFNLDGFGGDIKNHTMQVWADTYTEVDATLLPNGNHPSVKGTPFDLKEPRIVGDMVNEEFRGYDHNVILSPTTFKEWAGVNLGLGARCENSTTILNVYTDQPCMQLYTGQYLGTGPDFKGGIKPIPFAGLCFEAQIEPDAVNRGEGIYSKGEEYKQTTVYEFIKK